MMNNQEINNCKHPKEKFLFILAVIGTSIILSLLLTGTFFRKEITQSLRTEFTEKANRGKHTIDQHLSDKQILETLPEEERVTLAFLDYYYWYILLLVPLGFFLFLLLKRGLIYGNLRGNAVKLEEKTYPKVYKIFIDLTKELGLKEIPELYLVNGSGKLGAYANSIPNTRDFALIYSDLLDRCLSNNDMKSLQFFLAHELAHLKLNHTKWWYNFFILWMDLPLINCLLGHPLRRAEEYSCDKIAEKLSGDHSGRALLMLSAGEYAYQDIDLEKYTKEHFDEQCFWSSFANLSKKNALVAWRIAAIRKQHHAGLIFKNKSSKK